MEQIAANLHTVRERIAEAAQRAGRDPDDVTLVAVCKTFPAESVIAAYEAGVRHFGENRVEEATPKIPLVKAGIEGTSPTWHMVGHIQSRKASDVVACFDYVHSVDSLKLAQRLSRYAVESGRVLPILLECNVSGEESKYGFDVRGWSGDSSCLDAFLDTVASVLELPGCRVRGLMTMAPWVDDPEIIRPVFSNLRGLSSILRERFADANWDELSMGMSDDFEIAIEEGATLVRIGRAIFGSRPV
ncbi:MAG: YggS family pyridoxal phosphate-dependent enzyme [Chloroflexi bacterium]|nr:YggS family pyridoxal phosphate-dependent enzyme [Chloroflexota bacterium]